MIESQCFNQRQRGTPKEREDGHRQQHGGQFVEPEKSAEAGQGNGASQANNPDLKWEEVATTNLGIDFAILNNKITGSIDWYKKKTSDMIFPISVSPAIVPGGRIVVNGGNVENTGIELIINATAVSTQNFTWTTTLNMSHNKNLITSLKNAYTNGDSTRYSDPEGPGQTGATLQLLKVGYPIGQYFTLSYAGKDANGVSQFYKRDGTKTSGASFPSIGTDYWYMGNAQPKLLLGWNNNIRYKNFDLNFFLRGTFGHIGAFRCFNLIICRFCSVVLCFKFCSVCIRGCD